MNKKNDSGIENKMNSGLSPQEEKLIARMSELSTGIQPDPQFVHRMEITLVEEAHRLEKSHSSLGKPKRRNLLFKKNALIFAGALVVILFVIFIQPLLQGYLTMPTSDPKASQPGSESEKQSIKTASPPLAYLPPLGILKVQAAAPGGVFGKANPTLGTQLPDSPNEVEIFSQDMYMPLTIQNAQQRAEQLGIHGKVYQSPGGEVPMTIYLVDDGRSNVYFLDTPEVFSFSANYGHASGFRPSSLGYEQLAKNAEAFLREYGLLNFDYRIEPVAGRLNTFQVLPIFNGYALYENDAFNPRMTITMSTEGQVSNIYYRTMKIKPLGKYPLRTAKEAWEMAISDQQEGKVMYLLTSPEAAQAYPLILSWTPVYQAGQAVDIYDYVTVFPSAVSGEPPLVKLGLNLIGDFKNLDQNPRPGRLIHAWGLVEQKENGGLALRLKGWEAWPSEEEHYQGIATYEKGVVIVKTENGGRLILLNPPTDLPDDSLVELAGVTIKQPKDGFVWRVINVLPDDIASISKSEGGGGGYIAPLGSTQAPEPTPVPLPYKPGDRIVKMEGMLMSSFITLQNGERKINNTLSAGMSETNPNGWVFNLQGTGIVGIEKYTSLLIKVWGTYSEDQGKPVILIERYEQAVPGQKFEAWLGTEEIVTLEGKEVILFTSLKGEKFVRDPDINFPSKYHILGRPGDRILIEGLRQPDFTVGGFPVVRTCSGWVANERDDLNGYELMCGKLDEMIEIETTPQPSLQGLPTVEKVELMYYAYDFSHGYPPPPADDPTRVVQAVWVFSGHLANGQKFEVLVQAVKDNYIK